jgi:hypothetical protein
MAITVIFVTFFHGIIFIICFINGNIMLLIMGAFNMFSFFLLAGSIMSFFLKTEVRRLSFGRGSRMGMFEVLGALFTDFKCYLERGNIVIHKNGVPERQRQIEASVHIKSTMYRNLQSLPSLRPSILTTIYMTYNISRIQK